MSTSDRIGEALLQAGVVDAAGLARAAEAQAKHPATLGRTSRISVWRTKMSWRGRLRRRWVSSTTRESLR